jgi:CRP-like cAMP-binding protein
MPSLRKASPRQRVRKQTRAFDPQTFLTNAGIGKTVRRYKPKQTVLSQGEPADTVFYIQEGTVRLNVISTQGKEATLASLGPGDFIGEGCLASDQPIRLASATALTDSSILRIEKKRMLNALHEEHEFSDMFVAYVVTRHNRTQADLVNQLFNLKRETLGTGPLDPGPLRKRRYARNRRPWHQPGNLGGNGWHHRLARQLLHEQNPKARIHSLQRRTESTQIASKRSPSRVTQSPQIEMLPPTKKNGAGRVPAPSSEKVSRDAFKREAKTCSPR